MKHATTIIFSALQKYWNSKDNIVLLAGESRHLQIWLKDEYETKLQNVTFYYWVIQHIYQLRSSALLEFHPPIWCEHKYWNRCLTGLSKWSAVSCGINSSGIKHRECVVSVVSITSAFWILHSMMTHTNWRGSRLWKKSKQFDAKIKELVN